MKKPTGMALWAMVGALAGGMTWGVGPARAGDAVSKSSQPYIAPILPTLRPTAMVPTRWEEMFWWRCENACNPPISIRISV